jgi:hypothetical protein
MENFDTMLSQRVQLLLIFEKYKFRKYRVLKTSEETVWRCTNKNCIATVYTLNSVFSRKEGTHNHNLEEELLVRQKVSNSLKRQAQEDISAKPAKLIRKELNNQRDALETISVTDFRYIRNNINRARLQLVPKLPRSAEEVQIFLNTANLKTSKEEPFLLCNNLSENIVVFSCKSNIEFMCQQDTLYMDGTFEFCTKFFGQLFTIHALCNEVYVPVVFCLLKNKSKSTYLRLFNILKEKCDLMHCILNPKTIVIDFEMAVYLSVEEVWQGVQIIGCRFHLAQSWYVLFHISFLFVKQIIHNLK